MSRTKKSKWPDLIGLAKAAEELGLAHGTLRLQASRGRLHAVKIGRDWMVTHDELERYRVEVMGKSGLRNQASS